MDIIMKLLTYECPFCQFHTLQGGLFPQTPLSLCLLIKLPPVIPSPLEVLHSQSHLESFHSEMNLLSLESYRSSFGIPQVLNPFGLSSIDVC